MSRRRVAPKGQRECVAQGRRQSERNHSQREEQATLPRKGILCRVPVVKIDVRVKDSRGVEQLGEEPEHPGVTISANRWQTRSQDRGSAGQTSRATAARSQREEFKVLVVVLVSDHRCEWWSWLAIIGLSAFGLVLSRTMWTSAEQMNFSYHETFVSSRKARAEGISCAIYGVRSK